MNTPFVVGQSLGRYELLLPLGTGGMAQVWAGRLRGTRGFQKIVAIKTILTDNIDHARIEQMFLEEATIASQIHHPNVVSTIELGEHEGLLYLVMDWVHGEPLSAILQAAAQSGGLPLSVAVNLISQVARGLHSAHDLRDEAGELLGVVHRDISAQNVLVAYDGTAKLVDFGIAKVTARASALTQEGEVKGKFAYMAPEQVSGQPIDRRADIFGMGVLLYVATTGQHPFRGENPAATVRNICSKEPPTAPSQLVAGYPRQLEAVVMKALAKSPDQRFPTARDLVDALDAVATEALEGSFESQVSDYLAKLCGSRPRDRLNELRQAQVLADQRRGDGASHGSHSSVSSLRAVSVAVDASSVSRLEVGGRPELRKPSGTTAMSSASSSVSTLDAQPSNAGSNRRLLGFGAIAAAAVACVFLLVRAPRDSTSTAAGSPHVGVSAATLPGAVLPPAAKSAPGSETTSPPASASAAPPTVASTRVSDGPARAEPSRVRRGVAAPAAAARAPLASAAPAVPAPLEAKKLNAWDDKNYGGRR
jgi:serine/threonine-protein kinase